VNSVGALSTGWFSELDNLHKRLGELHPGVSANAGKPAPSAPGASAGGNADAAPAAAVAGGLSNAFWLRGYASQLDADLGLSGLSTFRQHQYGADIGYDHAFATGGASVLYLGSTAGYQTSRLRFHDTLGSKGNTESAILGAYASWAHRDGWYVDGLAKGQYFSGDFDSGDVHGESDSYGLGVSLEIGRRFDLGAGWFVEPSLQLAYSHLFSQDYTLNSGLRIHPSDSDIFRYVESLRLGKVFDLGSRGILQPYVRGAVERQDSDGGSVRISDGRFQPTADGLRGLAGVGVNWAPTSVTQLYFEYEYTFGDKYERPWSLTVGYRHRF
jgi:outer membrane autotransporter protein